MNYSQHGFKDKPQAIYQKKKLKLQNNGLKSLKTFLTKTDSQQTPGTGHKRKQSMNLTIQQDLVTAQYTIDPEITTRTWAQTHRKDTTIKEGHIANRTGAVSIVRKKATLPGNVPRKERVNPLGDKEPG